MIFKHAQNAVALKVSTKRSPQCPMPNTSFPCTNDSAYVASSNLATMSARPPQQHLALFQGHIRDPNRSVLANIRLLEIQIHSLNVSLLGSKSSQGVTQLAWVKQENAGTFANSLEPNDKAEGARAAGGQRVEEKGGQLALKHEQTCAESGRNAEKTWGYGDAVRITTHFYKPLPHIASLFDPHPSNIRDG